MCSLAGPASEDTSLAKSGMSWRMTELLLCLWIVVLLLPALVVPDVAPAPNVRSPLEAGDALKDCAPWEAELHRLLGWQTARESAPPPQLPRLPADSEVEGTSGTHARPVRLAIVRSVSGLRATYAFLCVAGIVLLLHRGGVGLRPDASRPPLREGLGIFVRAQLAGEFSALLFLGFGAALAGLRVPLPTPLVDWVRLAAEGVTGCALAFLIMKYWSSRPRLFPRGDLRRDLRWAVVVLALGLLGRAVVQSGDCLGLVTLASPGPIFGRSHIVATGAGQLLMAPVVEELAFRGLLFDALRTRWSFALSAGVSSAAFALMHLQISADGIVIFILGLAMAYGYERTRSLVAVILAHSLYNAQWFIASILLAQ